MLNLINKYINLIKNYNINNNNDLLNYNIKFNSKKGLLNKLFKKFQNINKFQKKQIGIKLNFLKKFITIKYIYYKHKLNREKDENNKLKIDLTLPGEMFNLGFIHPINIIKNKIFD